MTPVVQGCKWCGRWALDNAGVLLACTVSTSPLSDIRAKSFDRGFDRGLRAHVEVLVEREVWIYDRGYGRFLGQLVFKDERVERIEFGERRE